MRKGAKGLRRKVWTQTKILSPNIRYFDFFAILRFDAIYTLFGTLWTKNVFILVKNSVSWARCAAVHIVHYYMVYITYYTELNLQIRNYAQKRRICCENSKYALYEFFCGHFCPRRKGCQFLPPCLINTLRRKGGMYAMNIVFMHARLVSARAYF